MNAAYRTSDYDPAKERAWHLSVWLSPEGNSWCVHDKKSGTCVALQADRGEALPAEALLPKRPVSVSFTALPEISTLVPESALAPGSEMRHLKMVHGALPTGLLRDEPIGALGARCVYLHDEQMEHRLLMKFPNARSIPLQAVLIQSALSRSAAQSVVFLHRSEKRLDLVIARDQQLLLSNTFHAVNAEDVLYYTLFALEQCGAKPAAVNAITGGTHLSSGEEEMLARYLPKIAPAVTMNDASIAGLKMNAPHHFTGLLEQFACAS